MRCMFFAKGAPTPWGDRHARVTAWPPLWQTGRAGARGAAMGTCGASAAHVHRKPTKEMHRRAHACCHRGPCCRSPPEGPCARAPWQACARATHLQLLQQVIAFVVHVVCRVAVVRVRPSCARVRRRHGRSGAGLRGVWGRKSMHSGGFGLRHLVRGLSVEGMGLRAMVPKSMLHKWLGWGNIAEAACLLEGGEAMGMVCTKGEGI